LKENFSKENSLTNLIPELVEKYEPPIITSIKKKTYKLSGTLFNDIPIFEILLIIENKINE
tara:strand:- start:98 stop:280 length:183 start_codon:yes stop_codon:yes gene_type:complete